MFPLVRKEKCNLSLILCHRDHKVGKCFNTNCHGFVRVFVHINQVVQRIYKALGKTAGLSGEIFITKCGRDLGETAGGRFIESNSEPF